jgi:transmembrane sensor
MTDNMTDKYMPQSASEWLVALSEAPSDTNLQADFEAWLAESQSHTIEWEEMRHTYAILGIAIPVFKERSSENFMEDTNEVAIVSPLKKQMKKDHVAKGRLYTRGLYLPVLAVAALLIAALCVPYLLMHIEADYVTSTAELRTVTLEDGSVVNIAPNSAIAVNYMQNTRDVRLLKGKAFFKVVPNAARPFHVITDVVKTKVLGTSFGVSLHNGAAKVGVRSGHVHVEYLNEKNPLSRSLHMGEWVHVSSDGTVAEGTSLASQISAWQQGYIIANDRTAADVIAEIRPWYTGFIIVRDPALSLEPLTGVYNVSNPVEAVRAVATALGAEVQQVSPWLLVVSAH